MLRQRLGNLDDLLQGQAQVTDPHAWVDGNIEIGEQRSRLLQHAGAIQERHPAELASGGMSDEDVLGNAQVRYETQFLMNDCDSETSRLERSSDLYRLTIPGDLPCVRLLDSRQNLHERALAGTILADNCPHFPVRYVHRNIGQRLRPAEPLRHAA